MMDGSTTIAAVPSYRQRVQGLLVFREVLQTQPGQAFLTLLTALTNHDAALSLRAYGDWFEALALQGESWLNHGLRQIAYADNGFSQAVQSRQLAALVPPLVQAASQDLQHLQSVFQLAPHGLAAWVQTVAELSPPPIAWDVTDDQPLPFQFTTSNWGDELERLAHHYQHHGVGLFAQYRAFSWQNGQLTGIANPDPIHLDELTAYDHPRQQLLQNTLALLRGYPALNVLLYGSRGAGKSSLVKALLTEYHPQGLRLVEVGKSKLQDLPQIVEQLRAAPQKFIIFVDDLSFEEDDDAFKALKVVLEGSVVARPANVVVYATSNRRHLVREYFAERPRPKDQDEIQAWDTLQEKLSFSDRFGLTLTFEPADQPTYLAIVKHLAHQANLPLSEEELVPRALQWATRHNGRSGRSARQFVDYLMADLKLQDTPC
jgi:predicted AAA+ superfamily ATPase